MPALMQRRWTMAFLLLLSLFLVALPSVDAHAEQLEDFVLEQIAKAKGKTPSNQALLILVRDKEWYGKNLGKIKDTLSQESQKQLQQLRIQVVADATVEAANALNEPAGNFFASGSWAEWRDLDIAYIGKQDLQAKEKIDAAIENVTQKVLRNANEDELLQAAVKAAKDKGTIVTIPTRLTAQNLEVVSTGIPDFGYADLDRAVKQARSAREVGASGIKTLEKELAEAMRKNLESQLKSQFEDSYRGGRGQAFFTVNYLENPQKFRQIRHGAGGAELVDGGLDVVSRQIRDHARATVQLGGDGVFAKIASDYAMFFKHGEKGGWEDIAKYVDRVANDLDEDILFGARNEQLRDFFMARKIEATRKIEGLDAALKYVAEQNLDTDAIKASVEGTMHTLVKQQLTRETAKLTEELRALKLRGTLKNLDNLDDVFKRHQLQFNLHDLSNGLAVLGDVPGDAQKDMLKALDAALGSDDVGKMVMGYVRTQMRLMADEGAEISLRALKMLLHAKKISPQEYGNAYRQLREGTELSADTATKVRRVRSEIMYLASVNMLEMGDDDEMLDSLVHEWKRQRSNPMVTVATADFKRMVKEVKTLPADELKKIGWLEVELKLPMETRLRIKLLPEQMADMADRLGARLAKSAIALSEWQRQTRKYVLSLTPTEFGEPGDLGAGDAIFSVAAGLFQTYSILNSSPPMSEDDEGIALANAWATSLPIVGDFAEGFIAGAQAWGEGNRQKALKAGLYLVIGALGVVPGGQIPAMVLSMTMVAAPVLEGAYDARQAQNLIQAWIDSGDWTDDDPPRLRGLYDRDGLRHPLEYEYLFTFRGHKPYLSAKADGLFTDATIRGSVLTYAEQYVFPQYPQLLELRKDLQLLLTKVPYTDWERHFVVRVVPEGQEKATSGQASAAGKSLGKTAAEFARSRQRIRFNEKDVEAEGSKVAKLLFMRYQNMRIAALDQTVAKLKEWAEEERRVARDYEGEVAKVKEKLEALQTELGVGSLISHADRSADAYSKIITNVMEQESLPLSRYRIYKHYLQSYEKVARQVRRIKLRIAELPKGTGFGRWHLTGYPEFDLPRIDTLYTRIEQRRKEIIKQLDKEIADLGYRQYQGYDPANACHKARFDEIAQLGYKAAFIENLVEYLQGLAADESAWSDTYEAARARYIETRDQFKDLGVQSGGPQEAALGNAVLTFVAAMPYALASGEKDLYSNTAKDYAVRLKEAARKYKLVREVSGSGLKNCLLKDLAVVVEIDPLNPRKGELIEATAIPTGELPREALWRWKVEGKVAAKSKDGAKMTAVASGPGAIAVELLDSYLLSSAKVIATARAEVVPEGEALDMGRVVVEGPLSLDLGKTAVLHAELEDVDAKKAQGLHFEWTDWTAENKVLGKGKQLSFTPKAGGEQVIQVLVHSTGAKGQRINHYIATHRLLVEAVPEVQVRISGNERAEVGHGVALRAEVVGKNVPGRNKLRFKWADELGESESVYFNAEKPGFHEYSVEVFGKFAEGERKIGWATHRLAVADNVLPLPQQVSEGETLILTAPPQPTLAGQVKEYGWSGGHVFDEKQGKWVSWGQVNQPTVKMHFPIRNLKKGRKPYQSSAQVTYKDAEGKGLATASGRFQLLPVYLNGSATNAWKGGVGDKGLALNRERSKHASTGSSAWGQLFVTLDSFGSRFKDLEGIRKALEPEAKRYKAEVKPFSIGAFKGYVAEQPQMKLRRGGGGWTGYHNSSGERQIWGWLLNGPNLIKIQMSAHGSGKVDNSDYDWMVGKVAAIYAEGKGILEGLSFGTEKGFEFAEYQGPALDGSEDIEPLSLQLAGPTAPLRVGQTAEVSATVKGGKPPYKYSWQGDHAGKGAKVSVVGTRPGEHSLSLLVTSADEQTASADLDYKVEGIDAKIQGLPGSVAYASAHAISVTLPPTLQSAKVIWQSEPNLSFEPVESADGKTRVTFDRRPDDKVKVWAQILDADGSTLGEADQVEVSVEAPQLTLRFAPVGQKVGQEVVATIDMATPIKGDLIDFRWIEPEPAMRQHESGNAQRIRFVPKDTKPLQFKVQARVPTVGDDLGELSGSYTALPYRVTAKVVDTGMRPQIWKPGVGLVDAPSGTHATGQRITVRADIAEHPNQSDVRWKWTANEGTVLSNPGSRSPTVSRSEPGEATLQVQATDGKGIKLGNASLSFPVAAANEQVAQAAPQAGKTAAAGEVGSDGQALGVAGQQASPLTRADSLVAQAQTQARRGDLEQAASILEQARKLDTNKAVLAGRGLASGVMEDAAASEQAWDFERAAELFDLAKRLDPYDSRPIQKKAITEHYHKQKRLIEAWRSDVSSSLDRGDLDRAEERLKDIARFEKTMPPPAAERPETEALRKRYEQAQQAYETEMAAFKADIKKEIDAGRRDVVVQKARQRSQQQPLRHDERNWLDVLVQIYSKPASMKPATKPAAQPATTPVREGGANPAVVEGSAGSVVGSWLYQAGSFKDTFTLAPDGSVSSKVDPSNTGTWRMDGDELVVRWKKNGWTNRYRVGPGDGPFTGKDIEPSGKVHTASRSLTRKTRVVPKPLPSAGEQGRFRLVKVPGGIGFEQAQQQAKAMGGQLAVITSHAENLAAFAAANDADVWEVDSAGNSLGPWLGGYRADKSGSPTQGWVWHNGEPWGFTSWSPGEPNNYRGAESHLQFFTHGRGERKPHWNDIPPDYKLKGFLVEMGQAGSPEAGVGEAGSRSEELSPGWDGTDHPLQRGKVSWSATPTGDGRMAFRATYQLEGARPNHGYIAGVHFFEPKGTKLADITAFGGRRLPGGHDVLTRDGVTATVIAAWDFGTLHADAKGNARAEFSYSIPARDYHLQFTVRRGECRPDQGKTSGCAAVFRSGSRFGQNLTVISPSSTGKQSKAAHPSVAGEWIVEGGYCTGSPMQVVQAASGEVKSISSDITCRNGETGGWDGRNIRWTGPSTLTFDYAIRPGSAPNLKGGAVRIEYKSDGSATQHWHASTGQSGSENLRRGKPADASLGSHPRVDGVWVQQGGYCDGARQTVSQDPSGKVTSIVTPFKCRNGETGTWDASNIRWESRNVLRYDYSFRPGGPANFEPGHHRLEFVDAANAKLAFKTANHSGNEKLIRKAGVDGNRVVD